MTEENVFEQGLCGVATMLKVLSSDKIVEKLIKET